MNTTMKRRLTAGLMVLAAGAVLACTTPEARADRVRVAASLPGLSFDFGPHHGAVALGTAAYCRHEPRQIWREPVYEWREVWVDVPAVIERRRVAEYGACGQVIGYRYVEVVIEPARRELRRERILVREGFFETVYDGPCHRCGHGASIGVVHGHPGIVISKAPRVTHVRRVAPGPRAVRIRHPARAYRGGVPVRVRR